jgi:competence protein ComEC
MKKVFLSLIVIVLAVWLQVLIFNHDKFLEVDFFDVGQGDAILIRTPEKQTMLIDGGPGSSILGKLGDKFTPFNKRIDIVILTHPHADHVTGLIEVLKRYEIGLLILNGVEIKSGVYSEFLKTAKDKNIKILIAEAGEAIHFGPPAGGLEFDILSPRENLTGRVFNENSDGFGASGNDANDTSIVGKLIFEDFSIIFTGDATLKIENQLLVYGDDLKSDILKVGHHGSKYSSSLSFLKMVSPKAGIIEVGAKNWYGLPSPAALSRFQMVDANIFRTDQNGDIRVLTDGFTTNIYKEK